MIFIKIQKKTSFFHNPHSSVPIGCDAGVPSTHRLHGGDEGAAGGQRPQGKQDRGHERKRLP